MPHHSANDQRGDAGIPQPFAATSAQVVSRSVLDGSACPLVCLFDYHACLLADAGYDLADPLGVKSVVACLAPDACLQ